MWNTAATSFLVLHKRIIFMQTNSVLQGCIPRKNPGIRGVSIFYIPSQGSCPKNKRKERKISLFTITPGCKSKEPPKVRLVNFLFPSYDKLITQAPSFQWPRDEIVWTTSSSCCNNPVIMNWCVIYAPLYFLKGRRRCPWKRKKCALEELRNGEKYDFIFLSNFTRDQKA